MSFDRQRVVLLYIYIFFKDRFFLLFLFPVYARFNSNKRPRAGKKNSHDSFMNETTTRARETTHYDRYIYILKYIPIHITIYTHSYYNIKCILSEKN